MDLANIAKELNKYLHSGVIISIGVSLVIFLVMEVSNSCVYVCSYWLLRKFSIYLTQA